MLILVGASASGKTEIVKYLIKYKKMEKLVTYTTRNMRIGEVDKIDYNFIDKELFKQKIKEGFFFEYVEYNENYYGTSVTDITDNKVVILEPFGLKKYIENAHDKVKVVYLKCQKQIREKRMIERLDDPLIIIKRLAQDDIIFNEEEIYSLADLVVDSGKQSIEESVAKIYKFYRG